MRKILALVLVIATLATLAILPVSAALGTGVYTEGIHAGKAKFDGTSTDMSFGNKLNNPKGDLIVTEFLIDSSISGAQATDPATNCYNYIEIYNRGETSVNLSNVAIVGISDQGTNSWWDNNGNFIGDEKHAGGMAFIDAGGNIYDGDGSLADGKYVHTGLTQAQANTNRQDKAPIDNPVYADMWLDPGEFAIVWLWSDNCVNASKWEGASLAEPMTGRANFPKFRDHYAELMGIQKYQTDENGAFIIVDGEYVFTPEFAQLESTLIVATHIDASLNLGFTNSSKIYALVDKDFDRTTEKFIVQGDATNPYIHNSKIYSFFGWGTGGSREIIGVVEDSATIFVPSASKAELYHAYKLQENAEYDVEANYDYVKIGIAGSYLEMAVMSTVETPSIGSMPSYQWKYVDPEQMELYAANTKKHAYISDWEKSWDGSTRNLAIQDATTGNLLIEPVEGTDETAWMAGTFAALKAERVTILTDDGLDAPEDERPGTIVDQYWWESMLGSNKKKNQQEEGMKLWVIIVIIVAAVVVVGGATVAIIIIVKKKKAAATAAWYAEHANEIPAEDATSEENKE